MASNPESVDPHESPTHPTGESPARPMDQDPPTRQNADVHDDHLHTEYMTVNMGPSHPATHGTVRFELTLDGETVVDMDTDIGYLHRGFEKMAEVSTYKQVLPYTDRLNYVSPLCNNVGWSMAVEKALGVEITDRCKWIRMIACELSRITDHLTSIGAGALELGGFTPFLYAVQAREVLWDRVEELTGARLTTSFTRVGGLAADTPDGWQKAVEDSRKEVERLMGLVQKLLTRNRIFYDRMAGVGGISAKEAIDWGFTGPCLRATGVDYDVRTHAPYLFYDQVEFDVPVGTTGDNYDRYLVRLEEITQSFRIIEQCFAKMEPGPVNIDDWTIILPPKEAVYNSIEGMIAHFKLIMEGVHVPAGEVYSYTEAGNGELGYYVVSDGSGRPWRVKVRPPCFSLVQALADIVKGSLLADIIPTFDTINMIGGEIDR